MSETVEWLASAFLVVVGSVFAVGGLVLSRLADLDQVAGWVEAGRITSTELTDVELIDAVYALIWGGGIGIAVTGGLLVVAGIAFFSLQRRARRRHESTGVSSPSAVSNAMLGAIVTVVASFVPFSPVLGGALAGSLQTDADGSGVRTGGLAGLFATVPVLVVFAAVTWSLLGAASGLTTLVLVVLALSLAASVAYIIGLSALGGFLGVSLRRTRRRA